MKWFLTFLCLSIIIFTPIIPSNEAIGMNQNIQRKIDDTQRLRREQSKRFEELIRKLQQNFKNQRNYRREIPDDVRIPKRRYMYKK